MWFGEEEKNKWALFFRKEKKEIKRRKLHAKPQKMSLKHTVDTVCPLETFEMIITLIQKFATLV